MDGIWAGFWSHLWILGAVAIGFVAIQSAWMALDFVRRRAHETAQRARHARLLDEQVWAARRVREAREGRSLSWSGWRKFELVGKEFEDEKREVCSFYLKPHDRKPIPPFQPGQYLTFRLEVPSQRRPVVRCYSLSAYDARPEQYRVSIKRAPPPAVASSFFLDRLEVGGIVDVRAPTGRFFLDVADPRPVVLLGSGVGVTPMLSMLEAVAASPGPRETWLFFGVREPRELIQRERIEMIEREHPHVRVRFCYSRLGPDALPDGPAHACGRITVDLLKHTLPSSNYEYFICGPTAMMDALVGDLSAWGVPRESIQLESFGGAPGGARKPALAEGDGPEITFRRSGKSARWNAEATSILEFALAHDVEIEGGCLCGDCGTCERAIISGDVEYDHEPAWETEAGTCLTCCSRPKGPLELDA